MIGSRPHRGLPGGQGGERLVHHPGQRLGGEIGEDDGEVERQLELVAVAVEGGHAGQVAHPGLAE